MSWNIWFLSQNWGKEWNEKGKNKKIEIKNGLFETEKVQFQGNKGDKIWAQLAKKVGKKFSFWANKKLNSQGEVLKILIIKPKLGQNGQKTKFRQK